MPNIILAIESSINSCSIAVYKNKIYSQSIQCTQEHTIKILPVIYKVLDMANIRLSELNYIIFSKGPGNFTGIRIATAISQGLSYSLKIPILGISTLLVLAEQAWRKYQIKKVFIAINARMGKFYWAQYFKNNSLLWIGEKTESLLEERDILTRIQNFHAQWTLIGNGWSTIQNKKKLKFNQINSILFPSAKDLITLAQSNIKKKNFLHYTKIKTRYLDNLFEK